MGHWIEAIIAKTESTITFEQKYAAAKSIALKQGFSLILLTEELISEICPDKQKQKSLPYEEFTDLNQVVAEVLAHHSSSSMLCYVETRYFGGDGTQSAIVWDKGEIVYGPKRDDNRERDSPFAEGEWPIDEALQVLGVKTEDSKDEFDTLELRKYR